MPHHNHRYVDSAHPQHHAAARLVVSPKQLCSEFGLRAVRYAGGLSGDERMELLASAQGALTALARALCVPTSEIGLSGKLNLFLGAQASDTVAARAAHGLWTLNIPGGSQAIGALAHNWAHFLDNHLAVAHGFASSAAMLQMKGNREKRGGSAPTALTAMLRELLLDNHPNASGFSVFATQALDADRRRRPQHFSTAPELFARAFEVWAEAALEADGTTNPFLVSTNGRGRGDYVSGVYPQGDERQRVAATVSGCLPALLQLAGMTPDFNTFTTRMEKQVSALIDAKELVSARNMMTATKALLQHQLLASNGGGIYGIEARSKDGTRWGAILPEMSGGDGDTRIQFYDKDGLLGHVVYRDAETALQELVTQRYVVADPGALDRLQTTPHWHHAIPAATDAQRRLVYGL